MSIKEEQFKSFVDWGFKLAMVGLFVIVWQSIGDLNSELKDVRKEIGGDITEVQKDVKTLIGEVSTLKGKMDSYHK